MTRMAFLAVAAAAGLWAVPAAADPFGEAGGAERHRAAFAGATVRLALGGGDEARVPQARLGFGFTDYRRDGSGALVGRTMAGLPIEAGLAEGRLQLFVGGESAAQFRRRLGIGGDDSTTPLLVIGGIAVAAAAVLVLTGDGDEDSPCPPGVEVCTQ